VLAIALIPSVILLAVGVALAGYLLYNAVRARDFASKIRDSERPAVLFFVSTQEERRLTLQTLAGRTAERAALAGQRAKTDAAAAQIAANLQGLASAAPASVQRNIVTLSGLLAKLPQFRQQIDAGQPTLGEAYGFYNQIIDEFVEGLNGLAQGAPDAQTAYLRVIAVPLFTSADEMQRGDALAAAGVAGGGLNEADFRTYVGEIGAYHAQLDAAVPRMVPEVKAKYDQLVASDSWKQLTTVENAFLRGNQTKLPLPEAQWRTAARNVGNTLMGLFTQQSGQGTAKAIDDGQRNLVTSIIAGAAAILVAIGVFLVALRLSNRLIGRLARLREDTLDIAEVRLPELVERVRAGESVDLDSEVSLLDHGDDEIGQVADAFNTAQQTAIAAAVDEAKTREGTNAVFLNIAHRSQVIVHRQLKVLDQAERKQEDPDQLDTLFQLDHLSTRARRNAENLIILGGGQPGRQWRNPVSLAEVARGASAETEDFARVKMSKLPPIAVNGPVVGDLVHLLAELIDNATSFSPPESRVEIRGNVVGRGVVIEVEDQGLGIESEQAEQRCPPSPGSVFSSSRGSRRDTGSRSPSASRRTAVRGPSCWSGRSCSARYRSRKTNLPPRKPPRRGRRDARATGPNPRLRPRPRQCHLSSLSREPRREWTCSGRSTRHGRHRNPVRHMKSGRRNRPVLRSLASPRRPEGRRCRSGGGSRIWSRSSWRTGRPSSGRNPGWRRPSRQGAVFRRSSRARGVPATRSSATSTPLISTTCMEIEPNGQRRSQ
jgi:hypothetical protein